MPSLLWCSPPLERTTINDPGNQRRPAVIGGGVFLDLPDRRLVKIFDATANPVSQQFFDHDAGKLVGPAHQDFAQLRWSVERSAIGEHAGGVNWRPPSPFGSSPLPNSIKVFERETKRIHSQMTACA